jgi:hypothetical protein
MNAKLNQVHAKSAVAAAREISKSSLLPSSRASSRSVLKAIKENPLVVLIGVWNVIFYGGTILYLSTL